MSAIHPVFAHAPKKVLSAVIKKTELLPECLATTRKSVVSPFSPRLRPNIPYAIGRTSSNNVPVYHLQRSGGNKKLTRVAKLEGDVKLLRDELKQHLRLEDSEITINPLTRDITVKGHRQYEIKQFLEHKFR